MIFADVLPDAPAIVLIVVPIAIALIIITVKTMRKDIGKAEERYISRPITHVELGCLITWWLLGLFWSFPIGFGIGVIVAIVGGVMTGRPVNSILVSLGSLELCILTGWAAFRMTEILAYYE